jgi:hypothetical protein
VNQIEVHPLCYARQLPLVDYCRRVNVRVCAYAPLASGAAALLQHPAILRAVAAADNDDDDGGDDDDDDVAVDNVATDDTAAFTSAASTSALSSLSAAASPSSSVSPSPSSSPSPSPSVCARVLLRWLLSHKFGIVVRSTTNAHIVANSPLRLLRLPTSSSPTSLSLSSSSSSSSLSPSLLLSLVPFRVLNAITLIKCDKDDDDDDDNGGVERGNIENNSRGEEVPPPPSLHNGDTETKVVETADSDVGVDAAGDVVVIDGIEGTNSRITGRVGIDAASDVIVHGGVAVVREGADAALSGVAVPPCAYTYQFFCWNSAHVM